MSNPIQDWLNGLETPPPPTRVEVLAAFPDLMKTVKITPEDQAGLRALLEGVARQRREQKGKR
jgi:hypothetical protein